MCICNPQNAIYMAYSMLFRGDIVPVDINKAIMNIKNKKTLKLVDWIPTGFKVGTT